MGDHPQIAFKPYSLVLKHLNCVKEESKHIEKAGIISKSLF